jgi:hypothetical protein
VEVSSADLTRGRVIQRLWYEMVCCCFVFPLWMPRGS